MADKTPLKAVYDGGGNLTALAEFAATDTIPLTAGGTGATTQQGAANSILPLQTGNTGKYLTTDGTNVSWGTVSGGGQAETFNPFLLAGM